MLWKVLGYKQEEVQEAGRGSIMRSFMIGVSEQVLFR
jgi:hypothetical protein